MQNGQEIHGVFTSSDATTAVAIPMYVSGGATTGGQAALTLASNQFVVITDIVVVVAGASTVHVFLNDDADGTADTGETVIRGTLAANGGVAKSFIVTPRTGAAGALPYVIAGSAVQIDITFTGRIIEA